MFRELKTAGYSKREKPDHATREEERQLQKRTQAVIFMYQQQLGDTKAAAQSLREKSLQLLREIKNEATIPLKGDSKCS